MTQPLDVLQLRMNLGESQEAFAARFYVSQSAVSLWEKNGPPTRGPIRRMLDELRMQATDTKGIPSEAAQ
jgi:DNA-binding transcriptional regulator YiaG|tara:strand:+ start:177 stop:386 length:210 start_codon:yes stop_codon:yes gene_type:complete